MYHYPIERQNCVKRQCQTSLKIISTFFSVVKAFLKILINQTVINVITSFIARNGVTSITFFDFPAIYSFISN